MIDEAREQATALAMSFVDANAKFRFANKINQDTLGGDTLLLRACAIITAAAVQNARSSPSERLALAQSHYELVAHLLEGGIESDLDEKGIGE